MASGMISVILIHALVPAIIGLFVFTARTATPEAPNTFKYAKFTIIIGGMGALMCITLNIFLLVDFTHIVFSIFMHTFWSVMLVAGLWMFLLGVNWKVMLEEDIIVYRDIFRIVRKIRYEDIDKVVVKRDRTNFVKQYKVYYGKRRIVLDYFVVNFNDFPVLLRRRLKKAKNMIKF